jgi:hypothetical protein
MLTDAEVDCKGRLSVTTSPGVSKYGTPGLSGKYSCALAVVRRHMLSSEAIAAIPMHRGFVNEFVFITAFFEVSYSEF